MPPRPAPAPAPAAHPHVPHVPTPPVPHVPAPAPHAPTTGISASTRNKILGVVLGALALAGGGAAIGYCNGRDDTAHDAAAHAEALRMSNESAKEALTRPHQVITISGQVSRKGNGIEFKPDHNELVIYNSGNPSKITGMDIEIRMEGVIYGIITLTFGSHKYQLARTGVTLDAMEGASTSVTLVGSLIQ